MINSIHVHGPNSTFWYNSSSIIRFRKKMKKCFLGIICIVISLAFSNFQPHNSVLPILIGFKFGTTCILMSVAYYIVSCSSSAIRLCQNNRYCLKESCFLFNHYKTIVSHDCPCGQLI